MTDLGARHNLQTRGQGRHTLVLGHGLATDQTIWRLLAPRLAADHRVVLLDWVGCGHADPTAFRVERHGNLAGHADDLIEVLGSL